MLLLILLLKIIFIIILIGSGTIGLVPDEAQYWTWAKELDWGYYSKPPGIAWQIWLGTQFLGDNELGVRVGAVAFSFFIALAMYRLSKDCGCQKQTACWTALVIALSPLGFLSSLMATTDNGLVLFWILATACTARSLTRGVEPNYLLTGLMISLGALFKWPVYIFWPFLLLFWIPFPSLRSRSIFLGIAVSLLALIPSILWNSTHEWATFLHVFTQSTGGYSSKGNPLDFFASQALLISPFVFLLLLMAFAFLIIRWGEIRPSLLFCGGGSLLIFSLYFAASFFQKMQGNWCLFAYPGAVVFLTWVCCERIPRGFPWLKGAVLFSLFFSLFGLMTPYLEEHALFYIPYRYNAFHHNLGWHRLSPLLQEFGYNPSQDFLFSDKYQMSSILSFYGPEQKRAYFLNLKDTRKNQFSYWPSMADEQTGRNGFFVFSEDQDRMTQKKIDFYHQTLNDYFARVKFLGTYPLFEVGDKPEKKASFFFCEHYNGRMPIEQAKY